MSEIGIDGKGRRHAELPQLLRLQSRPRKSRLYNLLEVSWSAAPRSPNKSILFLSLDRMNGRMNETNLSSSDEMYDEDLRWQQSHYLRALKSVSWCMNGERFKSYLGSLSPESKSRDSARRD